MCDIISTVLPEFEVSLVIFTFPKEKSGKYCRNTEHLLYFMLLLQKESPRCQRVSTVAKAHIRPEANPGTWSPEQGQVEPERLPNSTWVAQVVPILHGLSDITISLDPPFLPPKKMIPKQTI